MIRIPLIIILGMSLLWVSIANAASTDTLSRSRMEVLQIKNTLLLPQDKNIRLAHIWLAAAVFFFLLESVSGKLYSFSGGVAAILLVVVVSLTRSSDATMIQIFGWGAIAAGIRSILPYWIRAHNDELRDRRRVAREAREAHERSIPGNEPKNKESGV